MTGAGLHGTLGEFSLEQVLGLLESGKKTGVVEIVGESERGSLEVSAGALIGARYADDVGEVALGAIFAIGSGEFTFWSGDVQSANLSGTLEELLRRADDERARFETMRADIPDERMRFALSERAASGSTITVTSDQWRVLLAVPGEHDVGAIAARCGLGRLATLRQLHALYRSGLVDVLEPAAEAAPLSEPSPAVEDRAPEIAAPAPAMEVRAEARLAESAALAEPPPVAAEAAPAPVDLWAPPPPVEEASAEPTAVEPPGEELAPMFDDRLAALGTPVEEAPPAEAAPVEEAPHERAVAQPRYEEPIPSFDDRLAALGAPPATEEPSAPQAPDDFWTRLAARPTVTEPAPLAPPSPPPPEPSVDDRLAALFGAPAAPEAPPEEVPPPVETAAPEAPPAAAPAEPEPEPEVSRWLPPDATAPMLEAEAPAALPPEKRGLFAFLRRAPAPAEEPTTFIAGQRNATVKLAALANMLLDEYNSGRWGTGRVVDHMLVRLRLADEQADPLDRPLPVKDDRLDVRAIERGGHRPEQTVPYIGLVIRQIFDDGERVLGKDKAKRGYRTAVQRALGTDESMLRDRQLAKHLPKA